MLNEKYHDKIKKAKERKESKKELKQNLIRFAMKE